MTSFCVQRGVGVKKGLKIAVILKESSLCHKIQKWHHLTISNHLRMHICMYVWEKSVKWSVWTKCIWTSELFIVLTLLWYWWMCLGQVRMKWQMVGVRLWRRPDGFWWWRQSIVGTLWYKQLWSLTLRGNPESSWKCAWAYLVVNILATFLLLMRSGCELARL